MSYQIKCRDTRPKLAGYISDENGDPVNITGCTVTFRWWPVGNEAGALTGAGSLSATPTDGYMEFGFTTGQTVTPGRYLGEFELTGGTLASEKLSVPSTGFIDIEFIANP